MKRIVKEGIRIESESERRKESLVKFPPRLEISRLSGSLSSSLSVRFVWKRGKTRATAVMHRGIARRIRINPSLENLLPTRTALPLDATHLHLASRAHRQTRFRPLRRLDRLRIRNRKELSAAGQVVFAFACVVAAEAARTGIALRKNVHRPATDELFSRKFERPKTIPLGFVFAPSPKRDPAVLVAQDPAVGDRTAAQVAGQVFQQLMGVAFALRRALTS